METQSLEDSIRTSIALKLFANYKKAFQHHVTHTTIDKLPLSAFKKGEVHNFNPARCRGKTAEEAYPPQDRPRKARDISSVKFHQANITRNKLPFIWVAKTKEGYVLLDSAHRVVAYYLARRRKVPALVVH